MPKVLLIDDDRSICESLSLYLTEEGYEVTAVSTGKQGLQKSEAETWDVIILDIFLSDVDGLEVLERLRHQKPETSVIMITAFQDMPTTVRAMKLGAVEYIHKPVDIDELDAALRRVRSRSKDSSRRNRGSIPVSTRFENGTIIGKSKVMKEIFKTIGILSQSKTTVLIEGESGTGKELVARAIHDHTDSTKPFISINCSAIVETLLESELFGHEKGSFTGATYRKLGKFEVADSGTLLLDEIGEMSLNMQVKLLRVIQEREFERVGGRQQIRTDVRIIAATNRSIADLVKTGQFREDLYYRLNVIHIRVPPLRERREDLPFLVDHLVNKLNRELQKRITRIQAPVLDLLAGFDWPGNVRQLENTLRHAVVHNHGEVLMADVVRSAMQALLKPGVQLASSRIKLLDEVEKEHILNALKFADGNRGKACEVLGISRPTLQRKIRKYQISW